MHGARLTHTIRAAFHIVHLGRTSQSAKLLCERNDEVVRSPKMPI